MHQKFFIIFMIEYIFREFLPLMLYGKLVNNKK